MYLGHIIVSRSVNIAVKGVKKNFVGLKKAEIVKTNWQKIFLEKGRNKKIKIKERIHKTSQTIVKIADTS